MYECKAKEESYYKQKDSRNWLSQVWNIAYFHARVKEKAARRQIIMVERHDGSKDFLQEGVKATYLEFLTDFLAPQFVLHWSAWQRSLLASTVRL